MNRQEHSPTLVHAYNCSKSNTTGFSTCFLMYGHHPVLPIDIEFGVRTPDLVASITKNYVQKLKSRLDWAYKKAHEIGQKEREYNKKQYDCQIRCIQAW